MKLRWHLWALGGSRYRLWWCKCVETQNNPPTRAFYCVHLQLWSCDQNFGHLHPNHLSSSSCVLWTVWDALVDLREEDYFPLDPNWNLCVEFFLFLWLCCPQVSKKCHCRRSFPAEVTLTVFSDARRRRRRPRSSSSSLVCFSAWRQVFTRM